MLTDLKYRPERLLYLELLTLCFRKDLLLKNNQRYPKNLPTPVDKFRKKKRQRVSAQWALTYAHFHTHSEVAARIARRSRKRPQTPVL